MTYLSLFSGIGGGDWGMHCAGLRCVGQVEIVPFRRRVLARHFPDVPQWDDITTFDLIALGWEIPDVVLFGSPCQDLSIAGRRAGLEGKRSGLFFEATRIIRSVSPAFVVWENVPGALTSSGGDDFAAIIDELADCGALDIQWRVLDSRYWGVAQRRRRVFVVADFAGERASKVLLEPACGTRSSAACATEGKDVAATITRGSGNSGGAGRRREDDVNLALQVAGTLGSKRSGWADDFDRSGEFIPVARTLQGGGNDKRDASHETYIPVARTLMAPNGQRYDGDTETFVVSPQTKARNTRHSKPIAHTLTSEGHDASEDGSGRGTPIVPVCVQESQTGVRMYPNSGTLRANAPGTQPTGSLLMYQGVRRLTPVEAERLQGLPDNWTAVDGESTPDSPRYAGVGDAMTASVVQWIGERLIAMHADGLRATQ